MMRLLLACTAFGVAVVACAPIERDLPNGDHVVTTYVGPQGADEARDDNLRVARQICGGGVVLIDEQDGTDTNGHWTQLVFGCIGVAADRAPSGAASARDARGIDGD